MQRILHQIFAWYFYIMRKIPVLNPSSKFSLIWDFLIIVFNIVILFQSSVILLFGFKNDKELNNTYMNIVNISFSLDILKELITGYFHKG
jgi:hypothetical protein